MLDPWSTVPRPFLPEERPPPKRRRRPGRRSPPRSTRGSSGSRQSPGQAGLQTRSSPRPPQTPPQHHSARGVRGASLVSKHRFPFGLSVLSAMPSSIMQPPPPAAFREQAERASVLLSTEGGPSPAAAALRRLVPRCLSPISSSVSPPPPLQSSPDAKRPSSLRHADAAEWEFRRKKGASGLSVIRARLGYFLPATKLAAVRVVFVCLFNNMLQT